jgi:hypothetical protein
MKARDEIVANMEQDHFEDKRNLREFLQDRKESVWDGVRFSPTADFLGL